MSSLTVIRTAIKTTIQDNIAGLRGHDTIPDAISPPAFVVVPVEADFAVAMSRGTDTWNFDILVLVSKASTRTAQDALDAYVTGAGASSIRQVIFNNRTLGLADTTAHIAGMSREKYDLTYTVGAIDYAGATLPLIVQTSGQA